MNNSLKITLVLILGAGLSLYPADSFQQQYEKTQKKRNEKGINLIYKIRKTLDKTEAAFNEVTVDTIPSQFRSYLLEAARSINKALSLLIQQQLKELEEEKASELEAVPEEITAHKAP